MTDEINPASHNIEGTRVDLGDDLIEKTAILQISSDAPNLTESVTSEEPVASMTPQLTSQMVSPDGVADLLHSVKILMSEGLLEDAKKILHKILIRDSGNALARQELDEIHSLELKQIFGDEQSRKRFGKKAKSELDQLDSEILMRQLDEDLQLGIFSERVPSASADQLSLFQDSDLLASFCDNLEEELADASIQDWIDLGIGFLEMDLARISVRLFAGACRKLDEESREYDETYLSANCLLTFSLILAGRPYEAISKVQPLMAEAKLKEEHKVELFYLMGRIYEAMRKLDLAFQFYKQVIEIDSQYRDVDLRIRKVRE